MEEVTEVNLGGMAVRAAPNPALPVGERKEDVLRPPRRNIAVFVAAQEILLLTTGQVVVGPLELRRTEGPLELTKTKFLQSVVGQNLQDGVARRWAVS